MSNSHSIAYDSRLGPIGRSVAAYLRGMFLEKQSSILLRVDELLSSKGFRFTGILRNPNGQTGESLAEILMRNHDSNKIIVLTPTLINPQDTALLMPASVTRLLGKVAFKGLDIEATPEGYITHVSSQVNDRYFDSKNGTLVIGVLNTAKQDVIDAIELGGNNTVLVLLGHGDPDQYYASDEPITFSSVSTPKELLRAIIKHACYGISAGNRGRIATNLHYWDRSTGPLDFILDTFAEG